MQNINKICEFLRPRFGWIRNFGAVLGKLSMKVTYLHIYLIRGPRHQDEALKIDINSEGRLWKKKQINVCRPFHIPNAQKKLRTIFFRQLGLFNF